MLQKDSASTKLQLKPVSSHVIQSGTNFIHKHVFTYQSGIKQA